MAIGGPQGHAESFEDAPNSLPLPNGRGSVWGCWPVRSSVFMAIGGPKGHADSQTVAAPLAVSLLVIRLVLLRSFLRRRGGLRGWNAVLFVGPHAEIDQAAALATERHLRVAKLNLLFADRALH